MLRALQSLASHLKLLLDTPEHLWRFIERRRYLHSAWLFLLARVVHRTLTKESEDDGLEWVSFGIHAEVRVRLFATFINLLKRSLLGKISSHPTTMGDSFTVQISDYTQSHFSSERTEDRL